MKDTEQKAELPVEAVVPTTVPSNGLDVIHSCIPAVNVDEVALHREDGTIIQLNNPQLKASAAAQTYVVSAKCVTKTKSKLPPEDNLRNECYTRGSLASETEVKIEASRKTEQEDGSEVVGIATENENVGDGYHQQRELNEANLTLQEENRHLRGLRIKDAKRIQELENMLSKYKEKCNALFFAAKKRKEYGETLSRKIQILTKEIDRARSVMEVHDRESKKSKVTEARCLSLQRQNKTLSELVRRKSESLVHAMQALDNARGTSDGRRRSKEKEEDPTETEKLREKVKHLEQKLVDQKLEYATSLEQQRRNFLKLYSVGENSESDPPAMRHSASGFIDSTGRKPGRKTRARRELARTHSVPSEIDAAPSEVKEQNLRVLPVVEKDKPGSPSEDVSALDLEAEFEAAFS
mmetsp:Transcript_22249/g.31079  ORF Transcript_22249/g.31079 Transcript_22249/m.31079 type:complete len:409 (+) Transcript_22249:251-1477(+)|eukprot:CAMPEP_0184486396 /NCGR_PEP_ID=MMETSP0113_2-20130426/7885_1 /TAXON_ID=91329 /ORGANISM="Norrisiella sphaerica, Strain BC52" /LENGTH=408 /DNA_ID=CAMNT_0026868247 /DNA_START=196 /DNA_END=1422 /DNA_ORIENTATION=-